ncbi:MAG TPA: zf-HC2 domain-containing protein [Acidimicrobiales bacterium]|jgi:hypothetical protein
MRRESCDLWRGALAMDALGKLDAAERAGLRAHLDGCPSCRDEARDLAVTAGALALIDPAAIAPTASMPSELTEEVLGSLHRSARATRRGRRMLVGAVAGAGLVAASLVALAVVAAPRAAPPSAQRTVTLHGASFATASIVLTERPYGTALALRERGLPAGGVYTVSMHTSYGAWWSTGSIAPTSRGVIVAQMTCAVPMGQITGVRITTASGATVLRATWAGAHWTHHPPGITGVGN